MIKHLLIIVFVLFATVNVVFAQSDLLTKDLRLGDDDLEVFVLQLLLNSDPDTALTLSGPGSSGNETTFFGPLTHDAVIRFQEKYESDVLSPVNLVLGTGFFGPMTRLKANELLLTLGQNQYEEENNVTLEDNTPQPPVIDSVSPLVITFGDTVTITGSGFQEDKNNTIVTSLGLYVKEATDDGTKIVFNIIDPPSVGVDRSLLTDYEGVIMVVNDNGGSNMVSIFHTFDN